MAVCQSVHLLLIHRDREQAPSHIGFAVFVSLFVYHGIEIDQFESHRRCRH